MKIRFWGGTSLPAYGNTVEEVNLDIDGERYVVREGKNGRPVLVGGNDTEKIRAIVRYPDGAVTPDGHKLNSCDLTDALARFLTSETLRPILDAIDPQAVDQARRALRLS